MDNKQFRYQAVDLAGRKVIGIIEGKSKEIVAEILKQQGYFIIAPIIPVAEKLRISLFKERKLDKLTLANFAKKLSNLLAGGVSLTAALNVLQAEGKHQALNNGLSDILDNLNQGKTLSKSIKDTNSFPQYFLQTIEIGELSGRLPESLATLAKFYLGQYRLKQRMKRALIYPTFVSIGAILVISSYIMFVLPEMIKLLSAKGAELPLITRILLRAANQEVLIIIGLTAGVLLIIWWILSITRKGKVVTSLISWKFPIVSRIYQNFQYHNLCKGLGFMLTNGISLVAALDSNRRVSSDYLLDIKLSKVKDVVVRGDTLTEAIKEANIFTPTDRELIRVGEESGELGEIFYYLADFYEEQLEDYSKKLTSYLEPILIIFLTIVVAAVGGSIILPMYELTNFN